MKESFQFVQDLVAGRCVIISPKRAARPDVAVGEEPVCPFCEGREKLTPPEVYRIGRGGRDERGWQIRVVPNKYPFAPIHEVIIHTPRHQEDFLTHKATLVEQIFHVYRERYRKWQGRGQVVIFHNRGLAAAESLPHPHTQLAVMPSKIGLSTPAPPESKNLIHEGALFKVFAPSISGWPYESWILPKRRNLVFGDIEEEERSELAAILPRLLKKIKNAVGKDFSYNFYISPANDWYLRLIPRLKVIGGFELATGVFVNTTDPAEAAKELAW